MQKLTRLEVAMLTVDKFFNITNPTEAEKFEFIEAIKYVIRETNDPVYMNTLGANYYALKEFDLALKYYEMAAELGDMNATSNLGYIWYYGRTGKVDYEKAFHYFDTCRKNGDLVAAYKIADMYKNGYYVEKDLNRYKTMIRELYDVVKECDRLEDPVPEIFTRLARIELEEGKKERAVELMLEARIFLEQRICYNPFFGNLTIMKYLIYDTYSILELEPEFMGLYELYEYFRKPGKITMVCFDQDYELEAVQEGDEIAIRFEDRWFRNIDSFFQRAEIDGELLTSLYRDIVFDVM